MLVRNVNSRTKLYSELKPAAIKLRSEGKTFSEIHVELGPIPKATLSGWLKNVELSDAQKARIKKIMISNGMVGRQIGAWKNRERRLERIAEIKDRALIEYDELVKQPFFLPGLVLYLAEGSKKSEMFQFMNSDLHLIKIMAAWIIKVSPIDFSDLRFRLYIHELYAHENCETFWIETLNAKPEQFLRTIHKPTGREHKKNPAYKGCLRIEVRGSELYWKTMTWRDCLYSSIS